MWVLEVSQEFSTGFWKRTQVQRGQLLPKPTSAHGGVIAYKDHPYDTTILGMWIEPTPQCMVFIKESLKFLVETGWTISCPNYSTY